MSGRDNPLTELVDVCARALVDKPNEVVVRRGRGPHIELEVAPGDIGKVIGREGRTAQAIRTLLGAAADKLGQGRVFLDILD